MPLIRLIQNGFHCPIQPVKGRRQGHQKLINLRRHVVEGVLIPRVGQLDQPVMSIFLQQLVERLQPRLIEQCLALLILTGPHHWIDAHGLEVLAQHLLAEGMDGGNLRGFQIIQGATHDLRVALGFPYEPLVQALTHFRSSSLCEGDDQHAIHPPAFADKLHDAFHQHSRLAGACCRADEDRPVAGTDGLLLLWRPVRHDDQLLSIIFYHRFHMDKSVSRETLRFFTQFFQLL